MREETIERMNSVCYHLNEVAEMVREDTNGVIITRDHIQIIKHYNYLRLATALIKEAREALATMEENLSHEEVPNVMKEHNVRTITVEGVGRVSLSQRFSCSMLDKQMGMGWLRENGHDGLIQETVNSSTLGAFARSLLEDTGTELPTDIFKTSIMTYTSITKAGVLKNG